MRTSSTVVIVAALLAAAACSGGEDATTASLPTGTSALEMTAPDSAPLAGADSTAAPSPSLTVTEPPDFEPADDGATSEDSADGSVTAQPSAESAGSRDFSAIDPVLDAFVADRDLNGAGLVVVDRDDGIVHEQYVGEFSADRVSLVASSSKMVTAGVLMRLHDEGLLDIDAPVAEAVDWGAGNPDITPVQLVSNSSGLVGLGPNAAYPPYLCQFLAIREIDECAAEVFETPDDDGDIVPPDTEFRYGGAQWQVAGAIAEAVSGQTWAELIDETYIQPCGTISMGYNNHWAASSGFVYPADLDPTTLPPTENPSMEGGLYIAPPDYAELLLMHLRGGECDDGRVMTAESVDRMHADRVVEAYGDAGSANLGYGMGWWVDRDTGIISDAGAYGSMPWLDLEAGHGAYLVIEASSGLGNQLADLLIPVVADAMTAADTVG